MTAVTFIKLNDGWNAEPNAPEEDVRVDGTSVEMSFTLNPWAYEAKEGETATLRFRDSVRWRLGPTNDEGWFRGQCRYSTIAPAWGEFYEIVGNDRSRDLPNDWNETGAPRPTARHFLFYLRDSTFECIAGDWLLLRQR